MAYIGKSPVIGNFVKLDAITAVNGQAAYTMQNGGANFTDYSSVNQFLVSLNGTIQSPGSSFSVSSSTITFSSNLSTGDVIDFIMVFGNSLSAGTPTDATVSTAKIVDSAVTTAKINANAVTSAKLNNDIISGATELATAPADTDEFLVSDAGTLKRIDYSLIKGGGAWEKISTTTVTTDVASVDFNTLSTDYKDFKVVMSAVKNATHQQDLLMRVKRSGQSSFDSGASDYNWNVDGFRETGGVTNDAATGNSYIKITPVNCASESGVSGATNNFEIDVYNVHGTNNKKFMRSFMAWTEGRYGRSATAFGSGYRNNQEALIGLQFYFASGNIDEGFFTLYGRAI